MSSKNEESQEEALRDKSQDYPTPEELTRQENRLQGPWLVREGGQRFVDRSHEFWKERTGKPLSQEEHREAVQNLTGFFRLLLAWDQEAAKHGKTPETK